MSEKKEGRGWWALALLRSPRVRESDAAALLLRLLFRKYALDLGWDVRLTPEPKATPPPPDAALPSRAETGARLLGTCGGVGAYLGWVSIGIIKFSFGTRHYFKHFGFSLLACFVFVLFSSVVVVVEETICVP